MSWGLERINNQANLLSACYAAVTKSGNYKISIYLISYICCKLCLHSHLYLPLLFM